jgi:hypothetical protein
MTKNKSILAVKPRPVFVPWFIAGTGLIALLLAGCASRIRTSFPANDDALGDYPPQFLVGPASALLINTNAFSTRLTLVPPPVTNKVHAITGELLCQGSRLLFAPNGSDRMFVWDVLQQRGFVVSEILQGYAPISSPVQITNVVTRKQTVGSAGNPVNGHAGHEAEIAVQSNDGSTATFSVWCAADLDDFPVRITSSDAAKPFTISLSDLRYETLAAKLFLPPEDFTRYASLEAMNGELILRKARARTNYVEKPLETIPMPQPGLHHQ